MDNNTYMLREYGDLCDSRILSELEKEKAMNKIQHTPGPWLVESYNNHVSVVGNIQYTQQGTPAMISHICDCNNGYAHPEEWVKYNEANARLISCAPDLLQACIEAVNHLDPGPLSERLQQAIDKATNHNP